MKAHPHPDTRTPPGMRPIVQGLAMAIAAIALSSCGAVADGKSTPTPVAFDPGHWHKTQDKPPTWFPNGVPAGHPTTYNDGTWVTTGDAAGTRYFIPTRSEDQKTLIAEAITRMTPEKQAKINRDTLAENVKSFFGYIVGGILAMGARG